MMALTDREFSRALNDIGRDYTICALTNNFELFNKNWGPPAQEPPATPAPGQDQPAQSAPGAQEQPATNLAIPPGQDQLMDGSSTGNHPLPKPGPNRPKNAMDMTEAEFDKELKKLCRKMDLALENSEARPYGIL
jgi:hypothetical protein